MSWTEYEKQKLKALYPHHTDKELCKILGKTSGQIRGMKERLGLNAKVNPLSNTEKDIIRRYYIAHPNDIDIRKLSEMLHRPVTSISRYARSISLTNNSRSLTSETVDKIRHSQSVYRQSEHYIKDIAPKNKKLLAYYARNQHPKGMLGKHHTDSVKQKMSITHTRLWSDMSDTDRNILVEKIRSGHLRHSSYHTTSNAYSRCHGGTRNDLGMYFRSSWEANIARVFNYKKINWEYEPCRFHFKDTHDGVNSYQPDFFLSDLELFVEVKGWFDDKSILRLEKFNDEYPEYYSNLVVIDSNLYRLIADEFKPKILHWE